MKQERTITKTITLTHKPETEKQKYREQNQKSTRANKKMKAWLQGPDT